MKTCKEKAMEWGISDRSVNNMCKTGKIPGVMKEKVSGRYRTMHADL